MYNKRIHLSDCNGYQRFYDREHPLALADGMVYYHRHIMSIRLGRWLKFWEIVHHIDGKRDNNDPSNLVILTSAQHHKKHSKNKKRKVKCASCGKVFGTYKKNAMYCSNECAGKAKRKFNPTKEELEKLVWEIPTCSVAKLFGVSDKAIEKRCRLLGISKPPRGYWQKIAVNIPG